MKDLSKILVLMIIVTLYNCSSEDSDSESNQEQTEDLFNYNYEGEDIIITNIQATKVENRISVIGMADDGQSFAIVFNKFGDLSSANSYSATDFSIPSSTSFEYFKSNYFNFELLAIDEVNKRVSVNYSGNLYEDHYDINSDTYSVQGNFNVSYVDQNPLLAGLEVSAKFNGADWYSTTSSQSGGFFSGSDIELNKYSDDQYSIGISMNHDNTTIQSYDFSSSSTVNKITFQRYDPLTNSFVEYETSGVFNVIEKNVNIITQVIGTFDLIATNGDDVINITNGSFNTTYSSY